MCACKEMSLGCFLGDSVRFNKVSSELQKASSGVVKQIPTGGWEKAHSQTKTTPSYFLQTEPRVKMIWTCILELLPP